MSNITQRWIEISCDLCGSNIKRKNLKEHTTNVHVKNVNPRESQTAGQQFLGFKKKKQEEHKGSYPKRIKSIVKIINESIHEAN